MNDLQDRPDLIKELKNDNYSTLYTKGAQTLLCRTSYFETKVNFPQMVLKKKEEM